jgi:predicted ABC-type ATPase
LVPTGTVVAGATGQGKSTLTAALRKRHLVPTIDPDAIARALPGGLGGLTAGREAIRVRDQYVAARASFLFETTLSGGVVLRCMAERTRVGFSVDLLCIGVEDVQTLIDRIAARVALGGHHVPDEEVRRRDSRGMTHRPSAIAQATTAMVFYNSAEGGSP